MSSDTPTFSDEDGRRGDPDRMLTFTDGVIAIVITILVLELKVPDLSSGQALATSLEEMRPTFVAFVISFLLVGMYWVGHRDMFTGVRLVNRDVLWLNLLFLLPMTLIHLPPPSSVNTRPSRPLCICMGRFSSWSR